MKTPLTIFLLLAGLLGPGAPTHAEEDTRPSSTLAVAVDADDDAPRITRVPRVASAALILSLRDLVGLQLAEISPELRSHFGAKREAGLLVTRVRAGSPAEKASVLVGDVLESACGEYVGSTMQFRACLLRSGPAEAIPVVVVRGRERLGLSLRIDEGDLRPAIRDPLIETRADLARTAAAAAERADEMRKQVLREEIERLRRRLAALEAELERLQ